MLTSHPDNIGSILKAISERKPNRILDIGPGFGKYALLIRELFLVEKAERGDITPSDTIFIAAVENAKYFQKFLWLKKLYNEIFWGDVFSMPFSVIESFDLLLLIDVIEHWEKKQWQLFRDAVNTDILVSTPKKVYMFKTEYYHAPPHKTQYNNLDIIGRNLTVDYSTQESWIKLIKRR